MTTQEDILNSIDEAIARTSARFDEFRVKARQKYHELKDEANSRITVLNEELEKANSEIENFGDEKKNIDDLHLKVMELEDKLASATG